MAEKEEAAPTPRPAPEKEMEEGAKKTGFLTKTPALVGGAMLLEGIVLIAGVYVLRGNSGPVPVSGATLTAPIHAEGGKAESDPNRSVELKLVEFRAQNKQSGRTFLYDVSLSVRIPAREEAEVKQEISDNQALIQDRIRTIIAESDPDKLAGGTEPGMETLRRQVKHQMELIMGEGKIQEVLISRFIPFRTDY